LKVLIINDYADIIGGAERFLENLLYESENAAIDFHRLDIADQLLKNGTACKSNFFASRYNRISIIPKVIKLVTRHIEEIRSDLIHLNNNHLYTNSIIHSIKAMDIPVVWFIHDHYTLRRLQSVLYLDTKNNFTFLTHSPEIYDHLVTSGRKAYLVRVPFNHAKWTIPQKDDHGHRPIDLLYVGRIEKAKGIFTLVRAIEMIKAKMPSITLTVLGGGSQLEALKSLVSVRKLTTNIRIMGMQEDQELLRYYACARLLVFPSSTETLGYVGLEAQACGTPVIAFKNEGTSRWCRDNIDGFIVHGSSAQKLADKVLEIIHDDVILTRISTAARENIRLEGYNASSQEVPDIYKAILSW
jgi:glycosyltransferase involved in cell wall biosynthesis